MRDVFDAPTGRAEREHVADARFVDHLLVELTNAPAGCSRFTADHEDTEESAVGDGASGCHSQPLRAGPAGDRSGHTVPDDAGAQFGELIAGVETGEQVEGGVVRAAGQCGEWRTAPHCLEPFLDVDGLERGGGDRLLGEHVERVRWNRDRLDLARLHPLHCDRGVDEVGAMLGEQHAFRDLADLVASPTDALQPARNRRRGLDLDHEIDRTHVDAEFERARRDDASQST